MSNEIINPQGDENDLLIVMGQAQAMSAISDLCLSSVILKLSNIKESKSYKKLKGKITAIGESDGTWEWFCKSIGQSVSMVDERLQNLKVFGAETLTSLESAGVKVLEFRQLRKLPAEEIDIVKELTERKDIEGLADLVATLSEKHAREKSELTEQYQHLKEDNTSLEVRYDRISNENATLEKKYRQLADAPTVATDVNTPEAVCDARLEVAALYQQAQLAINDMGALFEKLNHLPHDWQLSGARAFFSALYSLSGQARGVALKLHDQFGAELDGDWTTQEKLSQGELFKCAMAFDEILRSHEFAQAKRQYERDLEKPKGKGRPKAAPIKG